MYRVEYLPRAVEDLEQLDRTVSHRIFGRLRWLADHFNSISPEATLRVITVHLVGHRRDTYS
jgi:mRNA-degrading endonuclease RelE of RelBE toxin-antitoxin system